MTWTRTRTGLAALASLAVVCDAASTLGFLHAGTGVEGNPVVAWSMALLGVVGALAAWSALRLAALWLIARCSVPGVPVLLLVALTAWSWAVVGHNLGAWTLPV